MHVHEQGARAKLMGVATSAQDAALMLEALEAGTHGVILRTDSAAEVNLVVCNDTFGYTDISLGNMMFLFPSMPAGDDQRYTTATYVPLILVRVDIAFKSSFAGVHSRKYTNLASG